MTRQRIQTIFLYGVFICYSAFLLKLLFLSRVSLSDLFDSQRIIDRSTNLIPFESIRMYLFGGSATMQRLAFGNVGGNIIAFVPLGAFLMLFKKDKRVLINLLLVFLASLSTEIIQWSLGIGAADIDDIILNSLGGLVGVLGYKILSILLRNDKNVRIAVTILSVMGLPVLLYLLFVIKLRL